VRFKIDPDSREHPYVQLAELLRAGIKAGEIGPRLPSLRDLAAEADVSVSTVQRAFGLLTDAGEIESIKGRGMFVVDK
jgi:GntR family transcriptional regulator